MMINGANTMRNLAHPVISRAAALRESSENRKGSATLSGFLVLLLMMASPRTIAQASGPSKIDLHSGDIFQVHMSYEGTKLSWSIKDTTTGATFSTSAPANIPKIVGGPSAFVGFTAGTGGAGAVQEIITWDFQTASNKIGFAAGTSDKLTLNGSASLAAGRVRLTDGGSGQASSVFFAEQVPVGSFTNDFTFQLTHAIADGFHFTIQGKGQSAVGRSGKTLATVESPPV